MQPEKVSSFLPKEVETAGFFDPTILRMNFPCKYAGVLEDTLRADVGTEEVAVWAELFKLDVVVITVLTGIIVVSVGWDVYVVVVVSSTGSSIGPTIGTIFWSNSTYTGSTVGSYSTIGSLLFMISVSVAAELSEAIS